MRLFLHVGLSQKNAEIKIWFKMVGILFHPMS